MHKCDSIVARFNIEAIFVTDSLDLIKNKQTSQPHGANTQKNSSSDNV